MNYKRRCENSNGRPVGSMEWVVFGASLLLTAAVFLVAGCTSDEPGNVGLGLVETQFDVVMEPLENGVIEKYSALDILDPSIPLVEQQVLYLGTESGTTSSILANIDFSDPFSDEFPQEDFGDIDKISKVSVRFLLLDHYKPDQPDPENPVENPCGPEWGTEWIKQFAVFQLDAPFDSTRGPGPVPAHGSQDLVTDQPQDGWQKELEVSKERYMQWLSHGGVVGLLIAEGDGSNPGISGYTARDFRYADLLPDDLSVEVPYGVSIVVELLNDERALIIPSQHDCSTFHEVAAAPLDIADGLMFRTGLRNYPVLYFDLSEVPKNVMINRAEIVVYSDTMTSFGPRVAMVATEIDTAAYAAPYDVLDLEELEAELLPISGAEVCSYTSTEIKIVVTRSIQRYSNSAYEGARGFALTGSEDFLIGFDLYDQDPDFWYTQLNMFGTDAADESKRPRLRVTYTADSELIGGGQ